MMAGGRPDHYANDQFFIRPVKVEVPRESWWVGLRPDQFSEAAKQRDAAMRLDPTWSRRPLSHPLAWSTPGESLRSLL
jgi:hypothetical protein